MWYIHASYRQLLWERKPCILLSMVNGASNTIPGCEGQQSNSGSFYGLVGVGKSLSKLYTFIFYTAIKQPEGFLPPSVPKQQQCCNLDQPKTAFNKYSKIYTIKWATEEKYNSELKKKKKKDRRKTISENSEYPLPIYRQTKTNFYGATGLWSHFYDNKHLNRKNPFVT